MTEPCAAACEQRSFIYTCALKRRHENTFNAYSNILVEHYLIKGAAASCVITLGMQFVMYTVATKAILYKICRENKNETYS